MASNLTKQGLKIN